jgi:hypothetical protein
MGMKKWLRRQFEDIGERIDDLQVAANSVEEQVVGVNTTLIRLVALLTETQAAVPQMTTILQSVRDLLKQWNDDRQRLPVRVDITEVVERLNAQMTMLQLLVNVPRDTNGRSQLQRIEQQLSVLLKRDAVLAQPPQATHLDLPISPSREMLHALRSFIRIATKARADEREILRMTVAEAEDADVLRFFLMAVEAVFDKTPLPVE